MPSVPPLLMHLTLPLGALVLSSLSLEVFKQGLNVYLWTVPELGSSTHIPIEAGMLSPAQEALRHLVDMV